MTAVDMNHPLLRNQPAHRQRIVLAGLLSGVIDPEAQGRLSASRQEEARVHRQAQADVERAALNQTIQAHIREQALADLDEQALAAAERIRNRPAWRRIMLKVCEAHGINQADVVGPSRVAKVITARHEICYRLVAEAGLSLSEAGRRVSRDHSSVYHGYRKHAALHGLPLVKGLTPGGSSR